MYKKISSNSLLRSVITLTFAVVLGVGLTGCFGKSKEQKKAEELAELLSVNGESYKAVKGKTRVGGYSVLKNKKTGEYIAFNVDKFDPDTMITADDYLSQLDPLEDRIGNLEEVVHHKSYTDMHGDTYDYTTYTYERGPYVFQHNAQVPKDLEKLGALAQINEVNRLSYELTENFGLSTARSYQVARSLTGFAETGKVREYSDGDYDALFVELLGASRSEVQEALNTRAKDDGEAVNRLVLKASRLNSISPEQIRSLLGFVEQI